MTEIITIRLSDNLRTTADIFNLDNLATTLTIDYSGMGVDGWNKYVDFETSDGNKTRFDLGTESVVHLDLSNTVTTTGILKVNPLALLPVESSSRDIAQKTFKTYVFNVQETVNAYGYGSDNRNDMLIPMALDLTRLLDMHKVTPLAIDTDLNNIRERGTYGYLGTNVIANTPIAGSFVVEVYGLPIETGGIMQVYHNLDSPDSNIYRRFYLESTGTFSEWSDPKYDLEELRGWTSEQIEQISGLSTEVVGDLLNLTQSFEDLQELVTTQVGNRLTELEGDVSTLQTTVNNNNIATLSQLGLLSDDINAVDQRITSVDNTLSQEIGVLDNAIVALETKTQFMDSPFDPSKISYTTLIEGTNLQNIKEPGFYRTNQSYMDMLNSPIPDSIAPFILEVQKYPNGSVLHTVRYIGTNQSTWTRFFDASTNQWDTSGWTEWGKIVFQPTITKAQNLPADGILREAEALASSLLVTSTENTNLKAVKDNITKLVFMVGRFKLSQATSVGTSLMQVPTKFRPASVQTFLIESTGSTHSFVRISIAPSGYVSIHDAVPAGNYLSFNGTVIDVFS